MSKMHKVVLPAALLLSMLVLSACASKPKEVAAEPAPLAVEQPAAPVEAASAHVAAATEQAVPAPVAAIEQLAPKPVVKKPRRHRKKVAKAAPAPFATPAPVAVPAPASAPVVKQETPPPAPVVVAPIEKLAEPGLLERYWLFILAIVLVVVAAIYLLRKKD